MLVSELETMSLTDMKNVARNMGIRAWDKFTTKDAMRTRIMKEVEDLGGVEELPDSYKNVVESEDIDHTPQAPKPAMRIKDYPRKKVIVSCRDSDVKDYAFGLNEYTAQIKMDTEIALPEPVIDHIKSVTDVRYYVDPETGFQKHEKVNKFFVSNV